MDRRDFFAASAVTGSATLGALAANADEGSDQDYLELKRYHVLPRKRGPFYKFFQSVKIPALNRLGINPVGVFNVMYGPSQPTIYVLIPHKSLESVVTLSERLLADDEYRKAGAEFVDASLDDAAYVRVESWLMRAFSHMPKIEVPTQQAGNKPRIFELRTYESHSMKAGKKKIEMFNEGGEIAIFKNTGLQPVFFGETIVGPQMPNLTYMLAFSDMQEREQAWKTFIGHPDWKKLSSDKQYANTVSNITDFFLRPTPFSQI